MESSGGGGRAGGRSSTRASLAISPNELPPLPCLMSSDEDLRRRIDESPTKNQKLRVILDSAMSIMKNVNLDDDDDDDDDDCNDNDERDNNNDGGII